MTKKISCNLVGPKNTLFWDKTNYATSQDKKITQPLRTKKSDNLLGQKKNMQPLETKKSRNILGAKKIVHPLGTKKSCNLSGK